MAKKKLNKERNVELAIEPLQKVLHFIVVRESDVSDRVLMQSMVDKTLYGCSGIPGVALARTFGLDPFVNPQKYGAQVKNTSTHKMVLFAVDGTFFLYAMGSAAKEDSEASGNDFLGFLVEILNQYRPAEMILANITRLMRATKRVGELQEVLKEVGCILRFDNGTTIDVRTSTGSVQFIMMISFAAFERDHIVLRMLAGLVASSERGEMHFRPEHLPLGYVMEGKKVVADAARKEDVLALLTILAQPMTRRQMAEAISAAGIRLHRSFGQIKSADPADARDMKGFIKGMEQWLDLYETGVHSVQRENPFFGLDRIGNAPVVRESESDRGYITLNYKWGMPKGGWAGEEELAQARASFKNKSTYGSEANGHKIRKPFLGLIQWRDDESNEWKVDSHCLREYRLRRRNYKAGAIPGWAEPTIDGEIVARIDAATLHRSIADGVQLALSTGVGVEQLQWHFIGEFSRGSVVTLNQESRRHVLALEEARLQKKGG
jgi:DNA invertase Pin-like site-specific DNA recombinase